MRDHLAAPPTRLAGPPAGLPPSECRLFGLVFLLVVVPVCSVFYSWEPVLAEELDK